MRNNIMEMYYRKNYKGLVKKITNGAGSVDNAEDVVQEAFTRALLYFDTYRADLHKLPNWFGRILNNTLRDMKRDHKMQGIVKDDKSYDEAAFEPTELDKQFFRQVEEFINTKPEENRDILYNYFILGLKIGEVALLSALSYSRCSNLISDFKKELKGMSYESSSG